MIALSLLTAFAIASTPAPGKSLIVEPLQRTAAGQSTSQPPFVSVSVTLECTARANGHVEDCRALGETHPGLGFARTAIALMQETEVAPGNRDIQFARTIQFLP